MSIVVHKSFVAPHVDDEVFAYSNSQYNRRFTLNKQLSSIPDLVGIVQVGASVEHQWDAKESAWVQGECIWIAAMADFDESKLVLPATVTVQVNVFKHNDNVRFAAPMAK
jgi:hypothetical protein